MRRRFHALSPAARFIERGSYATALVINPKDNLTVQREDGKLATYDPKRLQGITAYREREREFAQGDRIQFTAPDRNRHRELATVQKIDGPQLTVRMDGERRVCHAALKSRNQAQLFSILLPDLTALAQH